MVIARWTNEDRTVYAVLENDGSLAVATRSASYEIWGPPKKLKLESGFPSPESFVKTCMDQGTLKSELYDDS